MVVLFVLWISIVLELFFFFFLLVFSCIDWMKDTSAILFRKKCSFLARTKDLDMVLGGVGGGREGIALQTS